MSNPQVARPTHMMTNFKIWSFIAIVVIFANIFVENHSIRKIQERLKQLYDNDYAASDHSYDGVSSLSTSMSYESLVSKLNIDHESIISKLDIERDNQQIIVLAGPHKTGSTSIQNNFHEWTGSNKYLLKQWAWPVPPLVTEFETQDPNNWDWNPSKGFYALAELLRNEKYKINNRLVFQNNTKEEILHAYKIEFNAAWTVGYNLIIGSEAFDNIIKDADGEDFIDRFIELLPLLENEETFDKDRITVVVTYRVPRVKHLISIWRETKKTGQSFQQWLIITRNKLGAIDSLGLAEIFLKKGLKVVIADFNGISAEGYDISNVIACEILNATCTDESELLGSDPPLVMNTKQNFTGNIDVDDDRLNLMDEVLRKYDCRYLELFEKYKDSDKLMTIHPSSLMNVTKSCGDTNIMSRKKMKSILVCIAQGKDNCYIRSKT